MLLRDIDASTPPGSAATHRRWDQARWPTPLAIDRDALAKSRIQRARRRARSMRSPIATWRPTISSRRRCCSHLSRCAEDLIFFSSDEAGYIELPFALATDRRACRRENPDVLSWFAAMRRDRSASSPDFWRVKGIPLAYDKTCSSIRSRSSARATLGVAPRHRADPGLKLNRDRMRAAAGRPC
jgi:argininosuccinate lyase